MPFIRPSARVSFVFPPFHFLMLARSFGHMLSRSGDWDSERWRDSLQVTQQAGVSGFSLGHVSGLGPCGCCHRPPWPACFLPRRPLYPRPPSGTLPQPEACPPPQFLPPG